MDAASLCCALRMLASEGPHVASGLREAPASPPQPLWGGLRMLGLGHPMVPALSSGCWGLPWVPGTAGGSWVTGVSGSELPQAEAQGGYGA